MKKILICIIGISLLICGCGSGTASNATADEQTKTQASTIKESETESQPFKDIYNSGHYKVGTDIPSGEYVLITKEGSTSANFIISKDSNSKSSIGSDYFNFMSIVTVNDGEYFNFSGCGAVPINEFDEGYIMPSDQADVTLRVGVDIAPGEYKVITADKKQDHYYIFKDSRHILSEIVSQNFFENSAYVTLKEGQYIVLDGCKIQQ